MILTCLYILFIPIIIAFDMPFDEIVPSFLSEIFSIALILDFLINLNTEYYDKGVLIKQR